jgi:hypothetical protein
MAEEECTHFGVTTHTLAKLLIEVAESHGAHSFYISCRIFFFRIRHFIVQNFCGYKFYCFDKVCVRDFSIEFSGVFTLIYLYTENFPAQKSDDNI